MKSRARVEFYQSSRDGLWYWRFRAGNGRIVADSGQGYSEKRWALHGYASMALSIRGRNVRVIKS